jgi:hypothetical protein
MKEQAQVDSLISAQGYAAAQFDSWQRTIPRESDITGHMRRFTVRPVDSNMTIRLDEPGDLLDIEISPGEQLCRLQPGISYPEHRCFGDEHAVDPQFGDVIRIIEGQGIEWDQKVGEEVCKLLAVRTFLKGVEFDGHGTGPLHGIGCIPISARDPRAMASKCSLGTSQASCRTEMMMPFFPGC